MIEWHGLSSKTTPVDSNRGVSEEQSNTRLKVTGECQRRWGMLTTAIARQAGRILNIVSAHPWGGNFITMDVENPVPALGNSIGGFGPPPPPPWQPPKKKKPIIQPPVACTTWVTFNDAGTNTGGVFNHALPANSCAGTINVNGNEDASRPRGDDYGYSFVVLADGVPILTSGCLVNAATSAAIPPGTTAVQITVTPNCAGGGTVGSWNVQGTCP